jgi:two-component system, chemotaxis family, chemotaxis protein CheY
LKAAPYHGKRRTSGMRVLIAEDDSTSRRLLQKLLSPHGSCDVAVDGAEALLAFRQAWYEGSPYDLVCLDIMMPHMDGQEVLKAIRAFEEEIGVYGLRGVKVVMTTALDEFDDIMKAFAGQCEGYLIKPIEKALLLKEIKKLGLPEDA